MAHAALELILLSAALASLACDPSSFDGLAGGERRDAASEPGSTASRDVESTHGEAQERDASAGESEDASARAGASPNAERDAANPQTSGDGGRATATVDASRDASRGASTPADAMSALADATPADATPSDATTQADASRDAGPPGESSCYGMLTQPLFCDGFEAPTLAPPWTAYFHGGDAARLPPAEAFLGLGALRSRVTMPEGGGALFVDGLGHHSAGHLYVRLYLYVPSSFSAKGVSVALLGEASLDASVGRAIGLVIYDANIAVAIHPQLNVGAPYTIARDRWLCVQVDFAISPSAGTVRLRVDGSEVLRGAGNTAMPSDYDRLWIGANWTALEQTQAAELRFDELALATSDIPCR